MDDDWRTAAAVIAVTAAGSRTDESTVAAVPTETPGNTSVTRISGARVA